MAKMMRCPVCGMQNLASSNYCVNCRSILHPAPPKSVQETPSPDDTWETSFQETSAQRDVPAEPPQTVGVRRDRPDNHYQTTSRKKRKGGRIALLAVAAVIVLGAVIYAATPHSTTIPASTARSSLPASSTSDETVSSKTSAQADSAISSEAASARSSAAPQSASSAILAVPKSISVNQTLTDGYYTVGTDIPAGTYQFTAVGESGNVMTTDGLINEMMGNQGDKTFSNAKLEEGQVLFVSGVQLHISCPDASGNALKKRSQTGLAAKRLGAGNYTVGKDFKAGTYDLTAVSGSGNVICVNGLPPLNAVMGTNTGDGLSTRTYQHVAFHSGDILQIMGVTISISPSK